ncbi:btb poz domain protein [Diplodia corticola]|uniref:Btb poz domain protein n=1 Tax=Diplodia corticola TaxID=236234 RepID=A0A1J9RVB7_9PEZI|nr:btb poz domain protein [Diplodia corticola]OJD32335.1 btb poz domain protein [Diplodia corticola]
MSVDPCDDPIAPLLEVVRSHFNSETFSDVDVVCANDDAYKCHRLVLSQSPVLAKALDPQLGFKESTRGVIELNNDDPSAVKAMLEFLYTFDYTDPNGADYSKILLFDAEMYALGEIYAISSLKKLAKKRFQDMFERPLDGHIIAPAIRAIYDTTPETDRGLRDVVVASCKPRIRSLLKDDDFNEMMDNVGPFGKDLLLYKDDYTFIPVEEFQRRQKNGTRLLMRVSYCITELRPESR